MGFQINQVAVIGSGIMGSRIACLLAGVGKQVLLLDIVSPQTNPKCSKDERNALVQKGLQTTLKSKPSALYVPQNQDLITIGNLEDDLEKLKDCDWVIEVVVENIDIKEQLYHKISPYLKPDVILTTNTSSISINTLKTAVPKHIQPRFCGTHFFNPPRYLKLLEIIPHSQTQPELIDFLMDFGSKFLGKTTVLCKDSPAFIANRIGTFSIMKIFNLMEEMDLGIDEIDLFSGPILGRPKSATFRTCDVVGLDTLAKVAEQIKTFCPKDEMNAIFQLPHWYQKLLDNKWLGDKTNQGFYLKKKINTKTDILTLNLKSFEYEPKQKIRLDSTGVLRGIESLPERLVAMSKLTDVVGTFFNKFHLALFAYISHRVGEVCDDIFAIDDALKAGFGWEMGPFETWDLLKVAQVVENLKSNGIQYAAWVDEMLLVGLSFYKIKEDGLYCYDLPSKSYKIIEHKKNIIVFDNLKNKTVWSNANCCLVNLGDGILGLNWQTKMNTIGAEVIEGINKSIDIAEKSYQGLIIANSGANFSAGANLGLIFMLAANQEYDELNTAIHTFQKTMMRVRYSNIPVIVCPHNLCLGGGTELSLHADYVYASPETYMGLVEVGVGVIPGGGGTKEFVLRAAQELNPFEVDTNTLRTRFLNIAQAKVSTSGYEAFELGILDPKKDKIIMQDSFRIKEAKMKILAVIESGYVKPIYQSKIPVLGQSAMGLFEMGIQDMVAAGYASEYDAKVVTKLAHVMCGGALSEKQFVSENYLLNLEREAFLSLCGERKTMERMQAVLTTGKPIRN